MKKSLLVIALLSSIASTSFAAQPGFIIGADVGSIKNHDFGMDQKATSFGVIGGYRLYLNEEISTEFLLGYDRYSTDIGSENVLTPQIALAYDYPLNETYTLRPKIRIGKAYTKVSVDGFGSAETGRAVMSGIGFELAHKDNYSVEYTFKALHGNGYDAKVHQIGVNYTF
jgi:hypothetical protein